MKRLLRIGAIDLVEVKGSKKFYSIASEIKWLKFEKTQEEIKEENKRKLEKTKKIENVQSNLDKFFKE